MPSSYWLLWAVLFAIGAFTGVLASTFGIGCLVLVPLLLLAGMTQPQAVATALVLQLVPQSLFGVAEFARKGNVLVVPSLLVALGSSLGMWFGAALINRQLVSELWLRQGTAYLVLCTGAFLVYDLHHHR